MADLNSTIGIILQGTDLTATAFTSASSRLQTFGSNLTSAVAPVTALTAGVFALEAQALRLAVAFGSDVIDATRDYLGAQTELNKVLTASDPITAQVEADFARIGATYGKTTSEVTLATESFVKSGFDLATSLEFVELSAQGAIAGQIELNDVAAQGRAILSGFGEGADDAGSALDKYRQLLETTNFISNNFNADFDSLLEAFKRSSVTFSDAGFSINESLAALAATEEAFQRAEVTGTSFNTVLNRLVSTNADVVGALATLGITQQKANGELKTGEEIFSELAIAVGRLEGAEKLRLLQILAGVEQSGKLNAALASYEEILRSVNSATDISAQFTKEYEDALAGLNGQISIASANFTNFKAALGSQLSGELTETASAFAEIFRVLEEQARTGGLDPFIQQIVPQLNEIQRIAGDVALALPEAFRLAAEQGSFDAFGEGLLALFGDLAEVDITAQSLADLIGNVAETFEAFANFTAGVIDSLQAFAGTISVVLSPLTLLGAETGTVLGIFAGASVVLGTVGIALTSLGGIAGTVGKLIGGLGTTATAVFSFLGTQARAAVLATSLSLGTLSTTSATAATAATGIGVAFRGALGALATFAGPLGIALVAGSVIGLIASFTDLDDKIRSVFSSAVDSVRNFTQDYIFGTDRVLVSSAQLSGELRDQALAAEALGGQFTITKDQAEALGLGFGAVNSAAGNASQSIGTLGTALDAQKIAAGEIAVSVGDAADASEKGFAKTADAAEQSAAKVVSSTDSAIQKTAEYQLKLLELASDERIALIEASVSLNIAQLEADTEQVKAAFASIDNTVTSTGDLLGSLFDNFADLQGFDQAKVGQQIREENRRRDEALALQKRLIDAQIDKIRAQTRNINVGTPLINVDASGISAELQLVLDKIVKLGQIRVAEDVAELLLNFDPTLLAAPSAL